jgi:F-type H+-transporting ATPase subunit gamma
MSNPRLIKKRVGSIKNIHKITKALEMVSASKVQKLQDRAQGAKPYADKIYELVQSLSDKVEVSSIPLMRQPKILKRSLFILISTNRGLAGNLNTNLFKNLYDFINRNKMENYFITVGKKGRNFALEHGELVEDYSHENIFEKVVPIISSVKNMFINNKTDQVYIVYNDFVSVLSQEIAIKKLLPISEEVISTDEKTLNIESKSSDVSDKKSKTTRYSIEPSVEIVLNNLLPFYLEVQLTESFFEAEASEHSARMLAMKNASDNAHELTESLSLEYNKARQQSITTEINDIVTASESFKLNQR